MATADEIGQEKQGISERLPRLDAERTRLGGKLNELEIAERADTLRRKSGYYQGAEERTLCETCASGHWAAQRRRWPAGGSSLFPPLSFRHWFESAGTAATLQRYTEAVRPDRHPEFS